MYPIFIIIHTETTFSKASVFCSDGLCNINPLLTRQLSFWCVEYLHQQTICEVLFKYINVFCAKILRAINGGTRKAMMQKKKKEN